MDDKPTEFYEQMDILKSRGIIVKDEDFCVKILSEFNYYRLKAYLLPYRIDSTTYIPVDFEQIYYIYEFDRQLRALLLSTLEEIELVFRTKIAYHHSHIYGAFGYLDRINFNNKHNCQRFEEKFNDVVRKNKDNPFVKHHINNKRGLFPIWVAVELFSFGMLSIFYDDMRVEDKTSIASQFGVSYQHLESWLICLSTLRNRCAHYMRLYYYSFNKWPKSLRLEKITFKNTVFDYIHIMKYCYLDKEKWNRIFTLNLSALIEGYEERINLKHLGFPDNWQEILLNN